MDVIKIAISEVNEEMGTDREPEDEAVKEVVDRISPDAVSMSWER